MQLTEQVYSALSGHFDPPKVTLSAVSWVRWDVIRGHVVCLHIFDPGFVTVVIFRNFSISHEEDPFGAQVLFQIPVAD